MSKKSVFSWQIVEFLNDLLEFFENLLEFFSPSFFLDLNFLRNVKKSLLLERKLNFYGLHTYIPSKFRTEAPQQSHRF